MGLDDRWVAEEVLTELVRTWLMMLRHCCCSTVEERLPSSTKSLLGRAEGSANQIRGIAPLGAARPQKHRGVHGHNVGRVGVAGDAISAGSSLPQDPALRHELAQSLLCSCSSLQR